MGVTNLWQILSPVQQHRPLTSLKGQTLAVDLSIWVCETQGVKQMQGVVSKPFLRNLFFRISYLVQLGVNLVFVVEGDAPELKWEAMMKRQQARTFGKPTGGRGRGYRGGSKPNRRNFNSCLRECCELLDYLGIPYLQSKGEAEAMCAALNAAGVVDGCITNDGDAFLYGARTVYRNFTLNSKDPHVESYCMTDIERQLGLDRDKLVAMALLLGCDYLPKGVPGVGMDKAIKLMTCLQDVSVIKRLHEWRHMTEVQCIDQIEIIVRRKALSVPDFPQQKVIDEFINVKDKCPSAVKKWRRPFITKLQNFALEKLEWPVEYTLEKVLPLVTLWDMNDILHSANIRKGCHLIPNRIVKTRVRQAVPCFEIEWNKPGELIDIETEYLTTVEEREIFSKCFPDVVVIYEQEQENKKTKPRGQKKKKGKSSTEHIEDEVVDTQTMEEMSETFSNMVLSGGEIMTMDSNCVSSNKLNICIKPETKLSQVGGNGQESLKKTKVSSMDKMAELHLDTFDILPSQIDGNLTERQKKMADNILDNIHVSNKDEMGKSNFDKYEPIVVSSSSSCSSDDEIEDVYVPLSQRIGRKLKLSNKLNDICDKLVEPQKENLVLKNTCITDGIVNFTNLDSVNEESMCGLNSVNNSREERLQAGREARMKAGKVSLLDIKPKDIQPESIELHGKESLKRNHGENEKSVLKCENVDALALKRTTCKGINGKVKPNVKSCTSLNMVSTKSEPHVPVTEHDTNVSCDNGNLVSLSEHDTNGSSDDAHLISMFDKSCQIEDKCVLSENKNFININVKPLTCKTVNRVKNPTACTSENEENSAPLTCKPASSVKNITACTSEIEEKSVQTKHKENIRIKPNVKTNRVKNPIAGYSGNENSVHVKQNKNLKNESKPVNDSSISPLNNRSENTKTLSSSACPNLLQMTFSSPYLSQNKQFQNCQNKTKKVSVLKPLSSEGNNSSPNSSVLKSLSSEGNISSPNSRDKGDAHNVTNFGKLNFSVGTPNMSKLPISEISPSPSKFHAVNESTPSSLRKPEIYYRSPFALQKHVSPVSVSHGHHMTLHKTPSNEQASFQSTGSPSLFSFDKDMASQTFNTPAGSFLNEDKSLLDYSEARSMSEYGKFQVESSLLKSINLTTEETPEKTDLKNLSACMAENCLAVNLETIKENEENMSEDMVSNLNFDNLNKSYVFEANFDNSSNSYLFKAKFGLNHEFKAETDASFNVNAENVTPKCDISNPEHHDNCQYLTTKSHQTDHFNFDPTREICDDFENISDLENQKPKMKSNDENKICENTEEQNVCQNQETESDESEICFSFGFSIKGHCSLDNKGNIDYEVDYRTDKVTNDTNSDKDSIKFETYDDTKATDDITSTGNIKTTDDIIASNDITATDDTTTTCSDDIINTTSLLPTGDIKNNEGNSKTDTNGIGQVYLENTDLRDCLGSEYSKHENGSHEDCTFDFPDKESSVSIPGALGFSNKFDSRIDNNQEMTMNRTSDMNNMSVLNKTAHFLEKENSPVALADRLKRRLQSAGSVKFVLSDITEGQY